MDKLKFSANENIQIKIDMDNSKCKKPVKSFKVKLLRKITCLSGKSKAIAAKGDVRFQIEEYVLEKKHDGCAEKVRENRTIDFLLPAMEKKAQVDQLHPDLRHMARILADTSSNSLFKVEYVLDVFVKHLSKMEFGMGNKVSYPIQIY